VNLRVQTEGASKRVGEGNDMMLSGRVETRLVRARLRIEAYC